VSALRDAAVAYARAGYHVVPLHGVVDGRCTCRHGAGCEHPGKEPRWRGWQASADREGANPEFIGGLFSGRPMNIGLRGFGHGWAVLDADSPEAVGYLRRLASPGGPFAGAPVAETRRGLHVYVRTSAAPGKVREGLELKSDNVVAPPSVNPDGTIREWWPGRSILDCRPVPLPDALLPTGHSRVEVCATGGPIRETLDGRNDALFGLGCAMRRWGCGRETILAALRSENVQRCQPPLEDAEVDLIVRSLARYTPSRRPRRGAA
jgi:putative DNA primase/helicase